jgi:uncharacterized protein
MTIKKRSFIPAFALERFPIMRKRMIDKKSLQIQNAGAKSCRKSRSTFSAFALGLLFGLGLCLSGMTQPPKVLGFLDVSGLWDPSLAFVMGGAVGVGMLAFFLSRRLERSLLGAPFNFPRDGGVDAKLVIGSAIFGVGWGLSGVCPGPAIVNLGLFDAKAALFAAAMFAGMALEKLFAVAAHLRAIEDE